MAVRKLNPITPGQRHKIIGAFDTITASAPEKSLVGGFGKSGGRNNTGKMTMRYIGGGHKRKYRVIDFRRNKDGVPATVKSIEYDPNRSARIALLYYADGEKVTFLHQTDCKLVKHYSQVRKPLLKLEIHFLWKTFHLVRLFTILNFAQVKVLLWFVQQELLRKSLHVKINTLS